MYALPHGAEDQSALVADSVSYSASSAPVTNYCASKWTRHFLPLLHGKLCDVQFVATQNMVTWKFCKM